MAVSGLSCGTWDPCRGLQVPEHSTGSVVVAHGPSCPVACRILVPQPGIQLKSPALEVRFLTTGPPRSPKDHFLDLEVASGP